MTYQPTMNYGNGVVMAPCWVQFLNEVVDCLDLLPGLVNSGQLGNASHKEEGIDSDHNPFVQSPITGLWYIRAADFSGPRSTWYKLLEFWNHKYAQQDSRVYPYGYTNSDVRDNRHGLTIWFGGGLTRNGTDGPHAHLSSSRANTNRTGIAAWNPGMDRTDPWGLRAYLTGSAAPAAPAGDDDMVNENQWQDVYRAMTRVDSGVAELLKQTTKYFRIDGSKPVWYDAGNGTRQWITGKAFEELGSPYLLEVTTLSKNPLALLNVVGDLPAPRYVRYPDDKSAADAPFRVYQINGTTPSGVNIEGVPIRYWLNAAEYDKAGKPALENLGLSDPTAPFRVIHA
jgi:hypothetical protein